MMSEADPLLPFQQLQIATTTNLLNASRIDVAAFEDVGGSTNVSKDLSAIDPESNEAIGTDVRPNSSTVDDHDSTVEAREQEELNERTYL